MKKAILILTVLLLLFTATKGFSEYNDSEYSKSQKWTGNACFLFGMKYLNEHDWEPIEKQNEFGYSLDFRKKSWPFSLAIDTFYSYNDDTVYFYYNGSKRTIDVKGYTTEINMGIRKNLPVENFNLFAGFGLAVITGHIQVTMNDDYLGTYADSDTETGTGIWSNIGVNILIQKNITLGIQARYSQANVDVSDIRVDLGGSHILASVGVHWD